MSEKPTLKDQIACVERELAFRRRCYPNWIEQKKIKADQAAREIARMEAVLATLEQMAQK